jgi:hypothetical protein
VISGIGILLAHPRFYWGETGGVGTPSLFDLPLPFMLGGPSGWGRYLHFQSAWVCVLNLLLYVASGLASRHFQQNLAPAKGSGPVTLSPEANAVALRTWVIRHTEVGARDSIGFIRYAVHLDEKPWGQVVAYVRDLNGYLVEICTPMAG